MDSPVMLPGILVFIDNLPNKIDRVFLIQFAHSSLIGPNAIFGMQTVQTACPGCTNGDSGVCFAVTDKLQRFIDTPQAGLSAHQVKGFIYAR